MGGVPHLHQAYYRYPHYNRDGSPYGGAGLQVVYHRYVGTGPGVYKFGWTPGPGRLDQQLKDCIFAAGAVGEPDT